MNNINFIRVAATVFLVAYHVIGTSETGGMRVSDSSAWRVFSDILVDFRMPMFAFVAGAVYALRPIYLPNIFQFMTGKFFRLVVPGIVAAVLFWVLGATLFPDSFAAATTLLATVLLTTGHFWFLQAILLIFLVVGVLDALLRYRAGLILLILSIVLSLLWEHLTIPDIRYLRIDQAVYLTPYFLLGVLLVRSEKAFLPYRRQVLFMATALLLAGIYMNIWVYLETGRLSQERLDIQSLATGFGVAVLMYFALPGIRGLDRYVLYSFTIYLYHPLGTSANRRFFEAFELNAPVLHFVLGLMTGLMMPILIHILADRWSLGSRVVLGLRREKPNEKILREPQTN